MEMKTSDRGFVFLKLLVYSAGMGPRASRMLGKRSYRAAATSIHSERVSFSAQARLELDLLK